jgi:formiminoglutamase
VTIGLVADRIAYSAESAWQLHPEFWLNRIQSQPDNYLFNLSVLAYQSHFTDPKVFDWLDKSYFEYLRLGKVKQYLEETEPLLRDADMIAIDMNALKQADAPATSNPSPNGLTAEELCQICRYAGFNDKLSSFSLFNLEISNDTNKQTAQLAAQALWYFLDGMAARKLDYPIVAANFNEYMVQVADSPDSLTFWKSNRSERWWLQVPTIAHEKQARHRLFPCSYSDYLQACNGDLSERILLAYRRFL